MTGQHTFSEYVFGIETSCYTNVMKIIEVTILQKEYYKLKTEGFSVVVEEGKEPEPMFVRMEDGSESRLEVSFLENFTATVKATEQLSDTEKKSVVDFIDLNTDVVSDGFERWLNSSDIAISAHTWLQEIFPGLPDLDIIANVLIDIMSNLAS